MNLRQCFFLILTLTVVKADRRVYGGKIAREGQIPYAVFLETRGVSRCTASIIHEEWVLSAGHCVSDEQQEVVSAPMLKITAGTVDFMVNNNDSAQIRHAKKIFRHEKYMAKLGKHDISLINVEKPFTFSQYVKKVEFMTEPWPQGKDHKFESCLAAGWGVTERGRTTKIKYLNTSARHGRAACPCVEKYYILKRIICLPNIKDQGLCYGDSGGALVCDGKVVGVAHVVQDKRGCSYTKTPDKKINCGDEHVYGIYMYTCPYLDWISSKVPGVPSKPDSCTANISKRPQKLVTILFNILSTVFVKKFQLYDFM